jgi:hypothetical protein
MTTLRAGMGFVLAALSAILIMPVYAGSGRAQDVLVVPARHRIVQFAFDISALRDTALVAYDEAPDGEGTVLHAWDDDAESWILLTADEFAIGAFSDLELRDMFLLGSDDDLPSIIITGASQAKSVTRIDSLNLKDVANGLNASMRFKSREWKALSKRHGLQIKDLNYERRRWGRYGPPSKKQPATETSAAPMEEQPIEDPELDIGPTAEEKGLELAPEAQVTEPEPAPNAESDEVSEPEPEADPEPVVETELPPQPEIPDVDEKGSPTAPEISEEEAVEEVIDEPAPEDK